MADAQTGEFERAIAVFVEREMDLSAVVAALPALQAQRNLFLGRFGAEHLSELSGGELLDLLPFGGSEDSLCAWLQLRQGSAFDTQVFGDISGADPGELGLWRAGLGRAWLVPGPTGVADPREVDEDEAVLAALALRDELVAAVGALRAQSALPLEQLEPAVVQRAVAVAAPRLAGSAWLHKYLHLHHPDRVTGAATAAELDAHLRRLGLASGRRGLYERDVRIVQFWSRIPALRRLPPRLRYRAGEPPLATRLEAFLQRTGLLVPERARVVSGGAPRARDVSSLEAVEAIGRRLAQVAARFFVPPVVGLGTGAEAVESWEAGLILREDRLLLVAGPLSGLPRFVRELEILAGESRQRVLASNLRAQRFAVAVPPATTTYTWTAVGFEEELAAEMGALAVPGLAEHRATALRMGVGGVGHLLRGAVLPLGQSYALLIPPLLRDQPVADVMEMSASWRLAMIDLALPVSDEQRSLLTQLGLAVAPASLAASWVLASPRCYREGRGGERYPCFLPGDEPVVCIEREGVAGQVVLFIHGPAGVVRREIGPGERFLALTGLEVGSNFMEIVAEDGAAEIVHLPFVVLNEVPLGPRCEVVLQIGEEVVPINGDTAWEGDLTRLGESLPIALSAPPLWPVTARWRGARALRAGQVHADEDGCVDLTPVLAATHAERRRRRVGDLTMDLGEIGRVVLRHRRGADETELGEELSALLQERGTLVAHAAGQLGLLRGGWLEPVCEALGYAIRDLRPGDGPAPPPGLGVALLDAPTFGAAGWTLRPTACLLVIAAATEWGGQGSESPRGYGTRLCQRLGLRRAILTDGLRWALLSLDLKFLPQWRLDRALQNRSSGEFEGFLAMFLAEAQP